MDDTLIKLTTIENPVGVWIKLKTSLGESIQGEVFSFDTSLHLLAIYESGGQHESSTRKSFRIIKTNHIAQILECRQPKTLKDTTVPFADITKPLPKINKEKLSQREQNAIHKRREQLGMGVTAEAQDIFDALSRTLPCKWEGDTIVVLDSIKIPKPYSVDNVSGGNEKNMNQVKKILEGELRKLRKKKK